MRKDAEMKTMPVAIAGIDGRDMDPMKQFLAVKLQYMQNDAV